jgi:hypothetical protein
LVRDVNDRPLVERTEEALATLEWTDKRRLSLDGSRRYPDAPILPTSLKGTANAWVLPPKEEEYR